VFSYGPVPPERDLAQSHPGLLPFVEAGTGADAMLAYLQGLLTCAGGVMYVRDLSGRMLLANHGFEQLVGRPVSEIVGRTSSDLFGAEIGEAHLATDRLVLRGERAYITTETALDATGSVRQFVSHKFPLIDPDGVAFAIGGLSIDTTELQDERRAGREARFESETRFRGVFEHAPMGQVFVGMDRLIASVNEPMAAMAGYTVQEMIGRPITDFVPPQFHQTLREEAEALLAGRLVRVSVVRALQHRDGHWVPIRVTSALLPGADGAPRWWVTMVVDITDEERARVELQRAHDGALEAADRLRLLHSIATAANESGTLDELVPHLIETVCAHFGWTGGALVQWSSRGAGRPSCRHETDGAGLSAAAAALAAPRGEEPALLADGPRPLVVVPLGGDDPRGRLALLFAVGDSDEAWHPDLLALVGGECARVIERDAAARRLRQSEARFRSVFDSSPLAMGLTVGDEGTYRDVNEALCQLLGRTREQLVGAAARDIVHPDDAGLIDAAGAAAAAAPDGRHCRELRLLHSSGATVIAQVTLVWMDGSEGSRVLLAQIEDITARRTAEAALRQQAERDGLTGLANRTFLARELAAMGAADSSCAVLFIDLDGFKLINDTRGHDVGDEVLVEVAARLRAAVRPSDLVARFGGDEFVVLCRTTGHPDGGEVYATARRVADRIESSLTVPITTKSGAAQVTASIGISGGQVHAESPQELLQRADTAMYQAKRLGKDRHAVYDEHLHEQTVEYQRTEAALRNALDEQRLAVYFQPIVDLADDHVVGFEALVRLRDETGRIVTADRFIAVAEQSGLIVPIGTWVLQESCRTIAALRHRTGRPLTVAVNLAAQQASRADLADTVLRALGDTGLPTEALTLELTESALLEADDATLEQLVRLSELGVVIGLDDFGTGYSSLTYLRRFPVSHLKVDRSFVSGMTSDSGDSTIVRAVVRLASDLGLEWIAEGVETSEQRRELAAMGPGYAQGYLFSRPVPADQLPGLLDRGCELGHGPLDAGPLGRTA